MSISNLGRLIVSVGVAELAGVVGSIFTAAAIPAWYAGLAKPPLTPPNGVFAPVWTTLYLLMGVALFIVWAGGARKPREQRQAFFVFALQLALNVLWSLLFFGLENPGAGFIIIISLWLAILATILAFHKLSRLAAYLLVPYILWVSFAIYLNYSIWALN